MVNTDSTSYKVEDVVHSFEKQLELFFAKDFESTEESPSNDENLGQVFTPDVLAEFMFSLFDQNVSSSTRILDPCIGPNTFFSNLPTEFLKCSLEGIEIDRRLITETTKTFFDEPNRNLTEGSFFDLACSEKFDLIIQNPPYVRQELLADGVNAKSKIKSEQHTDSPVIPSKSNLYVYFLLKSILHLKENGVMVAVIYDSWLYSSFGKFLRQSFSELGRLSSIYHFKKSAFEDAEVGATVIKFIKGKNDQKPTAYFSLTDLTDLNNIEEHEPIRISTEELFNHSFNNVSSIDFESNFFAQLKNVVSQPIQRGTSAIVNRHFIFNEERYPESKPIIKDVSRIHSYQAQEENAYILVVNGSISNQTKKYLNSVKEQILDSPTEKYKAVKRDISKYADGWYKIKLKESANFIFNYYLRNNVDFIYNPNKHLASDNFYGVNIENDALPYMAVLNSSFTRLKILNSSRSQGSGLRKIQLYEFKEVPIISVEHLSKRSVSILTKLAKSLLNANRYSTEKNEIISQIDAVLLEEYNAYHNTSLSIDVIEDELKEYIN